MSKLVATTKIASNQHEIDLKLLEKLYYWYSNANEKESYADASIEVIKKELIQNVIRELLDSNLFEPSPALKRIQKMRDQT